MRHLKFSSHRTVEAAHRTSRGRFTLSLLAACLSLLASPVGSARPIVISEFLADNRRGLADEDRDSSGWIEIHNGEPSPVNLEGWFLTGTTNTLGRWRFPAVTVAPQGFLVVFASGKNRTNAAAPLHTHFKLNNAGEYLALVEPDGVTVSSQFAPYPPQYPDTAYGLGMTGVSQNIGPAPALDPADLFPYVHLRADTGVTTNALGNVTVWQDASTNAFAFGANHPHATANDPRLVSGPAAGTFAVNFDGSDIIDSDLNLQLFTSGSAGLVTWVMAKPASIPGTQRFIVNHAPGSGGSSFELGQDAGQVAPPGAWGIHRGSGNATSTGPRAMVSGGYRLITTEVLESRVDGANVRFYTNGVLLPNATGNWLDAGNYNTGADPLAIGARVDNHGQGFNTINPDSYFNGDLAEIILLRGTVTPEQRQGIESFLLGKYGFAAPNRVILRPQIVPGQLGYLVQPTPGALNGTPFQDLVADTRFSHRRGFYDAPFAVTITCGTPGALILYTTNGALPVPGTALVYSDPIPVTHSTVLRARATKDGFAPTDVDTQTYLFLDGVIAQPAKPAGFPTTWGSTTADYEMDPEVTTNAVYRPLLKPALLEVPTLSIVTDKSNLWNSVTGIYSNPNSRGDAWERPVSLEYLDPATGRDFQIDAGLRVHGGVSRGGVKQSFNVQFRSAYGDPSLVFPLFDQSSVTRFDSLTLRGQWNDGWPHTFDNNKSAVYTRDEWSRRTFASMGNLSSSGTSMHLYIDGLYWGLYDPVEHVNASFVALHRGGDAETYDVLKFNGGPTIEDGKITAWNDLIRLAEAGLSTDPAYQNIQKTLDLDNLIDFVILFIYVGNEDGAGKNYYGYYQRAPGSQWRFLPWDNEWCLGHSFSGQDKLDVNVVEVDADNTPMRLYTRLRANPEFRVRFGDRVQKHFFAGGVMTPAADVGRWAQFIAGITNAIIGESARWGDVNNQSAPGHPYTRNIDWVAENNFMLNTFFLQRQAIVLQQFRGAQLFPSMGAPTFSHFGGDIPAGFSLTLTQTNVAGTLFFTIDGTDPRVYGTGGVAPGAQAYTDPFLINSPTWVRARVLNGSSWSALTEAVFLPPQDLTRLRITELMYHPPTLDGLSGDEFEFVELKNTGPALLNLSGLAFTRGISFTFTNGTTLAPGTFVVLARNAAAFATQHPGVPIHGLYIGKLDNHGEPLVLAHPSGSPVLEFSYAAAAPWPVTPDGFGFSLVPTEPNGHSGPVNPLHWRASAVPGGSPGADDPDPGLAPIVINELLSAEAPPLNDTIELFNPTATDVNLAGWFLTDDPALPKKFRIPDPAMIPAHGFRLFNEVDFNSTPGSGLNFAFRSHGDRVYLFSGDAQTNLTGYSHGFDFGAAPAGVTFGRLVLSTGEEDFPLQLIRTFNGNNVGPGIGPVVINEIQYHPGAGEDEFIELKNFSAEAVPLFDPDHSTNTWRLNGAGFSFPAGTVLGPNQFLLLVAINPADFRARYAVPAEVQILGPYSGQLQDSGERLELQRPDVPDADGVAYITIDAVRYNDHAPWPPAADGSGPSLQRGSDAAYGNDPASWLAAVPTPGAPYRSGVLPTFTRQPQPLTRKVSETATFSVAAEGPAPLHYQWRFNGEALPGQTSPTLTLNNLQPSQTGLYSAVVFNNAGAVLSVEVPLSILRPPTIVGQPQSIMVKLGSNVTFTVLSSSSGAVAYQWRFNGLPLPNANAPSLTVNNAQAAQAGPYTVAISDAIGSVISEPAILTVVVKPAIAVQPVPLAVVAGDTAILSVSATGSVPLSYRWRKGATTMTNQILMASNSFFTIPSVTPNHVGTWSVTVTNWAGTTNSLSVPLGLLLDTDGDRLPDDWEQANGLNPTDAGDAALDPDHDGLTNAQEYVTGTDPHDGQSYLKLLAPSPGTGGLNIQFEAISNRTYAVLFSDKLDVGAWQKLAEIAAQPTNRMATVPDTAGTSQRFYRLVTPRVP